MSLQSREIRRATVAGLAIAAAAGAAASPAHAAQTAKLSYECKLSRVRQALLAALAGLACTAVVAPAADAAQTAHLDYECKFPLIVPGEVDVDLTLNIPATWPTNSPTEGWTVDGEVSFPGTTAADLGSIRGLTTIKGWATAYANLQFDNGLPDLPVAVDLEVAPYLYKKPSQGGPSVIRLGSSGRFPSLSVTKPGDAKLVMDELYVNLQALNASGVPLILAPIETRWDGTDHIDSDGDPTTFDLVCRRDPQANPPFDPLLAEVSFIGDDLTGAPLPPAGVDGTTTQTSATLTWNASTDPDGIKSYKIYQDGVLVKTVAGDAREVEITGLSEKTTYAFQVSAVDGGDIEGVRSSTKKLTTSTPADITPPTAPTAVGLQSGDVGPRSIRARWGSSTDEPGGSGLAGYTIEFDGQEYSVPANETSFLVTGLSPLTDYDGVVYAVDKAGNKSEPLSLLYSTPDGPPLTQDSHLSYECKYPLIVDGTIKLDLAIAAPRSWPVGTPTEGWPVNARFTIGGSTPADLGYINRLSTIKGFSTIYTKLKTASGAPDIDAAIDLDIEPHTYKRPSAGGPSVIELEASGVLPRFLFTKPDVRHFVADELYLNLQALDSTGQPLSLPPVDANWDDTDHIDSDGDPTTFDVVCRPNPAANPPFDPLLAIVSFGGTAEEDREAPSAPTSVDVQQGDITDRSLNLRWGASTDTGGSGLKGYVVQIDPDKSDGKTFNVAAPATSFKVTGLNPETEYEVRISAVDYAGNRSAPLQQFHITGVEQPDTTPPVDAAAAVVATPSQTLVGLQWAAATDDVGVAGYRVFKGATQVGGDLPPAARALTVSGLSSSTPYTFKVQAFDAAGNISSGRTVSATTLAANSSRTKRLSYECKFPLIVPGVIDFDVTFDMPDRWMVKTPTEAWKVTAVAKIGGSTPADMGSIRGLTTLKGFSTAYAKLKFDNGAPDTDVAVDLEIPSYAYKKPSAGGPSTIEFTATGTMPKLMVSKPARAQLVMDELLLNMQALDATGKPLALAPVEENWDRSDHIDSDGDPTTFDLVCRPNPEASPAFDPLLATMEFFYPIVTNTKPSAPTNLDGTLARTSATLTWTASTDADGIKSYKVYEGATLVATVPGTSTTATINGLTPSGPRTYSVAAVDNQGLEGDRSAPKTLNLVVEDVDVSPPSTPLEVDGQTGDVGLTSLIVRWGASADNAGGSGVKGYVVEVDGEEYEVGPGALSKKVEGLGPDTDYDVYVYAVDSAGNRSEPLHLLYTTLQENALDVVRPIDGEVTAVPAVTSVEVKWAAATDNVGVAGYRVFNGSTQVGADLPASATSLVVRNLTVDTAYRFKVVAFDAAGNVSAGATVDTRTLKLPVENSERYEYTLRGSTTLKTLTKGSLPLTGGIKADILLSTGAYSADLTLNQTTGRLTALGFLPVTAKIGFAPSGKTTGSLKSGVLTTSSKVRIKVQEVKLFGAIPLAGGNNCQTKQLSQIDLKSVGTFSPTTGGKLAGTYALSDLNGCGVLNGLVSPLTAGAGNTIDLTLTPKP